MKRLIAKLLLASIIVILFITIPAKAFLLGDNKENDSKTVAITVNGAKIYEDKVSKIAKYQYKEKVKREPSYTLEDARKDVMGEMITTEVILQEGRKKFVWIDNDEVQNFISENEKRLYDELKNIKDYKGDFDEFERNIKAGMLYLKLCKKECTKNIKPTEEQMKTYYNENIRDFQLETVYRIISIDFWPDRESDDPNLTEAKCKERAEYFLKKIRNGADFNEIYVKETEPHVRRSLAKHRIKPHDPNHLLNPDFVRMWRDAELYRDPEMKNALLSLKPGQVSEVITNKDYKGLTYFSIIKFIGKIDGRTKSYEEVKKELHEHVSSHLVENAVNTYSQKLVKEADIKFINPADDWRLQNKKEVNEPKRRDNSN
ncbi:MAG: peptidyl-prolyl cis-trans isomerase [Sedimentisphaerales bacterium]|jgi:hypothetical protein